MGLWGCCWLTCLTVLLHVTFPALLFSLLCNTYLVPPRSLTPVSAPSVSLFAPPPSYLALSGSGPVNRSQPPVRARPAPEQQLVLKGQEGECVRPWLCLSVFICVSVSNKTGLTWWHCVWRPLSTGWFSQQENRGLHLCLCHTLCILYLTNISA